VRRGIWVRLAWCAVVLAVVGAACGDDEGGQGSGISGTLVMFAYEDSFLPRVMDPFEAAHPELTVQKPNFEDEEEAETKLRAGFQADIVEMCAGETGGMIAGGLLQPIDTTRIDDWDKIFPLFLGGEGTVDDAGNVYMVPLQGGTSGIIYNTDAIPEGISSYQELFFGDYEGYIAISESYGNSIADMALALGYGPDIWAIDATQVAEAVDQLIALKGTRIRTTFAGDADLVNLLATQEVVASAHGFPSLVATLAEAGVNADYVAPAEGEISWVCGHGISATAQNVDAAYALINHYLSVESQVAFAEEEEYLATNSRVLEEADPEVIAQYGLDAPGEAYTGAIPESEPENDEVWLDEWRRYVSS
jgi:spermidine/putrescine-binding protein